MNWAASSPCALPDIHASQKANTQHSQLRPSAPCTALGNLHDALHGDSPAESCPPSMICGVLVLSVDWPISNFMCSNADPTCKSRHRNVSIFTHLKASGTRYKLPELINLLHFEKRHATRYYLPHISIATFLVCSSTDLGLQNIAELPWLKTHSTMIVPRRFSEGHGARSVHSPRPNRP